MNILIAPDSFKECLSSLQVAQAIEKGLRDFMPQIQCTIVPLSDGGDGFLDSYLYGKPAYRHESEVHNPLMEPIKTHYATMDNGKIAIIEMAKASGLELVPVEKREVLVSSTFGTGELIRLALDRGCEEILLGIGGSATNDGGVGMLQALGMRFFDLEGKPLPRDIRFWKRLGCIDDSGFDKRLAGCKLTVLCDVTNPLLGPSGASYCYGAQKGADDKTILFLERAMVRLAKCIEVQYKVKVDKLPGAGAAGGLGAALLAFTKAKFVHDLEPYALEPLISKARLIITGEGRIDGQSLHGKTIASLAALAKKHRKPLIAIGGQVEKASLDPLFDLGLTAAYPLTEQSMDKSESMKKAPQLIRACIRNIVHDFLGG